jgi:hypothetical protein
MAKKKSKVSLGEIMKQMPKSMFQTAMYPLQKGMDLLGKQIDESLDIQRNMTGPKNEGEVQKRMKANAYMKSFEQEWKKRKKK